MLQAYNLYNVDWALGVEKRSLGEVWSNMDA